MRIAVLLSVFVMVLGARAAGALEVSHVVHDPGAFDPAQDEKVNVRFHLSEPAQVTLSIFDVRERRIRAVQSKGVLQAGDQRLVWDGRDERGRLVPPEAYHYTLVAENRSGRAVEHDLTDLSGGEPIRARSVKWNAGSGMVEYILPAAGRIAIRIGLENGGPLVKTLVDWVPRRAGMQREPWSGKDHSGVMHLSNHPQLGVMIQAFSLPDNTIFVLPEPDQVNWIEDLPETVAEREPKRTRRPRPVAYEDQSPVERRDAEIRLVLPDELPTNQDGVPVVSGPVPVRMEAAEQDLARVLAERFEVVFYVDGVRLFENEVGFLPATWMWDPEGMNRGEHYVTGNLRGYRGHFGIASLKVFVAGSSDENGHEQ